MRLVLDSDVLVHALRIPKKKGLMEIHEKASVIFESCILKTNDLFLPSEKLHSHNQRLVVMVRCAQDRDNIILAIWIDR